MIYLLYGLFVLSCLVLILAVLLQPGKADAGALFTSSISSTAFGPRGTQTLLAKITIGAAATFMLLALTLSLPGITGSRSVVQPEADPAPVASPQQPAPAATTAPPQQSTTAPAAAPGNTATTNTNAAPAQSPQQTNGNR